jgi:hypothetical protein
MGAKLDEHNGRTQPETGFYEEVLTVNLGEFIYLKCDARQTSVHVWIPCLRPGLHLTLPSRPWTTSYLVAGKDIVDK